MKTLRLKLCQISTDLDLDFGGTIDFNIKRLDFDGTGHHRRSGWYSDTYQMIYIANSICESNLIQSLETVHVHDCGLTKNHIQHIFDKCSVNHHIKVDEKYLSDVI